MPDGGRRLGRVGGNHPGDCVCPSSPRTSARATESARGGAPCLRYSSRVWVVPCSVRCRAARRSRGESDRSRGTAERRVQPRWVPRTRSPFPAFARAAARSCSTAAAIAGSRPGSELGDPPVCALEVAGAPQSRSRDADLRERVQGVSVTDGGLRRTSQTLAAQRLSLSSSTRPIAVHASASPSCGRDVIHELASTSSPRTTATSCYSRLRSGHRERSLLPDVTNIATSGTLTITITPIAQMRTASALLEVGRHCRRCSPHVRAGASPG